jgi:hypothetical protein
MIPSGKAHNEMLLGEAETQGVIGAEGGVLTLRRARNPLWPVFARTSLAQDRIRQHVPAQHRTRLLQPFRL